MMTAAREYIHTPSIGSADQCRSVKSVTKQHLDDAYDRLALQGYLLLLIGNRKDVEDNVILSDYEQHTQGRFPFIYAFVQPSNGEADIDSFMEAFGYTSVTPGYIDE